MALFYNPETMTPDERFAHVKEYLSAYAKDHALTFSFSDTPKTNGKTVWLGALDAASNTFIASALAHGMHEMLHVTETTMAVFDDPRLDPFTRLLINVLEDVRIDALGMRRYPGYRAWRDDLAKRMEDEGTLRAANPPDTLDAAMLLSTWLHTELMARLHVAWAQRHCDALRQAILTHLDEALLERLIQIAAKSLTAHCTAEVRNISERLAVLLRGSLDKPGKEEPDLFDAPSASERARFLQALEACLPMSESTSEAPAANSPRKASQTSVTITDAPTIQVVDWPDETHDPRLLEDAAEYGKRFAAQEETQANLTQAFEQILRIERARSVVHREGCDLAEDYIERFARRDDRLFVREVPRRETDGDVIVLLDRSGSMGLDRMTTAKIAVASLLEALSPLRRVKTQVAVFPGPGREHLALLKHRDEDFEAFLRRLAVVGAFGATPLLQSLQWALEDLERSSHPVRLVVLITDGAYPVDKIDSTRLAYENSRIELAVMNIDTRNEPLSRNCVNVVESAEIAPSLLELIQNTAFAQSIQKR